jgi:hypothetical protein
MVALKTGNVETIFFIRSIRLKKVLNTYGGIKDLLIVERLLIAVFAISINSFLTEVRNIGVHKADSRETDFAAKRKLAAFDCVSSKLKAR